MAKNKPASVISKKHLARMERERRQTRAIIGAAIALLAIVVGVLAYGLLNYSRVARVHDHLIRLSEFQARARVQRARLIQSYVQNYQFALMFGSTNPELDPNWQSQLQGIRSQLEPESMGPFIMNLVVETALIRHYAEEHEIVVSQEEIDQAVREALRYYPDGTPTPAPTSTSLTYPTLSATELGLITPTGAPSPAPTSTPPPTATPAPTGAPTEVPTATATPTEFTLAGFESEYQEILALYQDQTGISEEEFVQFFFTDSLYRSRVYEVITADVPHETEQVWARHILVADEASAQTVLALLRSGEDFGAVAQEYSTDTGSAAAGGDLGWFGRGQMVPEFETAAFSLAAGEISEPILSQYGYHIIQVIARQNRPRTEDEYKAATDQAFDEWLAELRTAAEAAGDIVYYIEPEADNPALQEILPTTPTIDDAINELLQQMNAPAATP